MKSALFAFITLLSCAYVWCSVSPLSVPDGCAIKSCYGGLYDRIILTYETDAEQFCNISEGSAQGCLDALTGDQICLNFRDWAKVEYPYLCSLPREDVSASLQCIIAVTAISSGDLCKAELEATVNLTDPSAVCAHYTAILECYRENMMSHCPDKVEPALHFFTTGYDYISRGVRSDDCPVFQQPDTQTPGGSGASLSSSTLHWIETAMIALYISTRLYIC